MWVSIVLRASKSAGAKGDVPKIYGFVQIYWTDMFSLIKFIYSVKATKFCEIFPLLLTVCTVVKSKRKIS